MNDRMTLNEALDMIDHLKGVIAELAVELAAFRRREAENAH